MTAAACDPAHLRCKSNPNNAGGQASLRPSGHEISRFEVYKVIDHRHPKTVEFQAVQKEIEAKKLEELREAAQKQVLDDLRAKGIIVTIFDGDKPSDKSVRR